MSVEINQHELSHGFSYPQCISKTIPFNLIGYVFNITLDIFLKLNLLSPRPLNENDFKGKINFINYFPMFTFDNILYAPFKVFLPLFD